MPPGESKRLLGDHIIAWRVSFASFFFCVDIRSSSSSCVKFRHMHTVTIKNHPILSLLLYCLCRNHKMTARGKADIGKTI